MLSERTFNRPDRFSAATAKELVDDYLARLRADAEANYRAEAVAHEQTRRQLDEYEQRVQRLVRLVAAASALVSFLFAAALFGVATVQNSTPAMVLSVVTGVLGASCLSVALWMHKRVAEWLWVTLLGRTPLNQGNEA
jgi:small-conductance mechanosensitive channel